MHKKLILLLTLILLLSACTPVPIPPTPAPTNENTPTPTLTQSPTSTPVPWTSDTDIVFYKEDVIERCAVLGDYEVDKPTIDKYSLLVNCASEGEETRYCLESLTDGIVTETDFNISDDQSYGYLEYISPNGKWVAFISFDNSYKILTIISNYGTILNPGGTPIDDNLNLIGWLDNQTLLFDTGPYSFVDEKLRAMYAFNPFQNTMEKKLVPLDRLSPAEKFPIIMINPAFDQVFYYPVINLENEGEELFNSFVRDIETGEILWKGFEYVNYTFPDWSMDGAFFAVQNIRYSNSEPDIPHTLVILDSKGNLVKTLWFEFLDRFSFNQIKWSPDSKTLAIWVHLNSDLFSDFKLYLYDFDKSELIDTCYTGSGRQWIIWHPDSKGFIIVPGYNQISFEGPTYFDLNRFKVYPLSNLSDSSFQWIKNGDN